MIFCIKHTKTLVKLCVDHRFKPHIPPFEQIPANSVKFQFCNCTPQVEYLRVNLNLNKFNIHLLRCRLIGKQLLFDPHTFMPQCQFFLESHLHLCDILMNSKYFIPNS